MSQPQDKVLEMRQRSACGIGVEFGEIYHADSTKEDSVSGRPMDSKTTRQESVVMTSHTFSLPRKSCTVHERPEHGRIY
jgi:hypothetical protein